MRGANETITIWNKHYDGVTKKDTWYRHNVKSCTWDSSIIKTMSGNTAVMTSVYEVLISKNPKFKTYTEWVELEADYKASFFTLNVGDLVARGEFLEEITSLTPNTMTELKTRLLPNVFSIKVINELDEPYKKAPHYEVMGV